MANPENQSGNSEGSEGNGQWGLDPRTGQYPQYPEYQQYAQYQPGYGGYPGVQSGGGQDRFWGALFDFSFTKYATPSIIKFAYVLGFAFIALVWAIYALVVIVGLANEIGAGGAFLGLVIAAVLTLGALFTLMTMRMMLEFYLSNIRIAQAAQNIDQRTARREAGN